MKSTLKREYKELEVVEREAIAASEGRFFNPWQESHSMRFNVDLLGSDPRGAIPAVQGGLYEPVSVTAA